MARPKIASNPPPAVLAEDRWDVSDEPLQAPSSAGRIGQGPGSRPPAPSERPPSAAPSRATVQSHAISPTALKDLIAAVSFEAAGETTPTERASEGSNPLRQTLAIHPTGSLRPSAPVVTGSAGPKSNAPLPPDDSLEKPSAMGMLGAAVKSDLRATLVATPALKFDIPSASAVALKGSPTQPTPSTESPLSAPSSAGSIGVSSRQALSATLVGGALFAVTKTAPVVHAPAASPPEPSQRPTLGSSGPSDPASTIMPPSAGIMRDANADLRTTDTIIGPASLLDARISIQESDVVVDPAPPPRVDGPGPAGLASRGAPSGDRVTDRAEVSAKPAERSDAHRVAPITRDAPLETTTEAGPVSAAVVPLVAAKQVDSTSPQAGQTSAARESQPAIESAVSFDYARVMYASAGALLVAAALPTLSHDRALAATWAIPGLTALVVSMVSLPVATRALLAFAPALPALAVRATSTPGLTLGTGLSLAALATLWPAALIIEATATPRRGVAQAYWIWASVIVAALWSILRTVVEVQGSSLISAASLAGCLVVTIASPMLTARAQRWVSLLALAWLATPVLGDRVAIWNARLPEALAICALATLTSVAFAELKTSYTTS
ncbi:MAG: hypothetical protein Q8Q09_17935 [Deltaproteobacteria bacterium]|nr:hypothetical protein [Deltaproteobacteria bacterium]